MSQDRFQGCHNIANLSQRGICSHPFIYAEDEHKTQCYVGILNSIALGC